MTEVIVGVVSAAIGFVSGLLTPWVKWQVEKHRERLAYRQELIKTWRTALDAEDLDLTSARSSFGNSAVYSSLRAHLRREILGKIEAPRTYQRERGQCFTL